MRKIFLASLLGLLFFLTTSPASGQRPGRGFSGQTGFGGRPGGHAVGNQGRGHLSPPRAFPGHQGFSGVTARGGHSTGQFPAPPASIRSFAGAPPSSFATHRGRPVPHFQTQVTGFSGLTTFVPPGLGFDSYHSAIVNRGFFPPFPHQNFFRFGFNGFFAPCRHCFFDDPFVSHRFFFHHRRHFFFPFVPFFPTCTIFFTPGFINGSPFLFGQGLVVDDPPPGNVTASEFMASAFVPGSQASYNPAPRPSRPLFLLVFKDHSIYGITAYRIENGRIYYATSYGALNSVPLDLVDLDSTVQMNRDRGLDFSIEPAPDDES